MDDVGALKKRIADLEEAVRPLLPYAAPDTVQIIAEFYPSKFADKHFAQYRRDTLYPDLKAIFRRLKQLLDPPHTYDFEKETWPTVSDAPSPFKESP